MLEGVKKQIYTYKQWLFTFFSKIVARSTSRFCSQYSPCSG